MMKSGPWCVPHPRLSAFVWSLSFHLTCLTLFLPFARNRVGRLASRCCSLELIAVEALLSPFCSFL